ncbi:hypothetical protein AB0O34_23950 [Sphaerisporangium sp. NPDC088356]|uniref:AbiTii domain-containing protein n=1 Tax=Sphaerisporangium sp. NPDC088356 TaxID=3154871 RepID=UPI0034220B17
MTDSTSLHDRDKSLIDQIERDLRDPNVPVAEVLRLCVLLGGHAGSAALREWAKSELEGYSSEEEVPPYRVVSASLYMRLTNRYGVNAMDQRISPQILPEQIRNDVREEVRFTEPIAVLVARAKKDDLRFTWGNSEAVAAHMTREKSASGEIDRNTVIAGIYWQVSPEDLSGVVDRVRTALARLISELIANRHAGQEVPTSEQADHALATAVPSLTLNGNNNQIIIQNSRDGAVTSTTNKGDGESKLWKWIWVAIVPLVGAIAAVGQWLSWFPWSK